jgi:hypothetical protein
MIQLEVSNNRPSRLTGSPTHQFVDVAAPPRLNAAPSTAGAPAGTVPATIVVVVVDVDVVLGGSVAADDVDGDRVGAAVIGAAGPAS